MAERIITGIDIGTSKIAALVAAVYDEKDEVRVIGYHKAPSRGVKKGLIVDIDKVTHTLEDVLTKTERMAGKKINSAYVVVGGPQITSLNSHGVVAVADPEGEINESDVTRAIEAAKAVSLPNHREIIDILPQDFIVNGQDGISNPIGMTGVRLEVKTHLITASSTSLRNIDKVLSHLGVQRLDFVYSALASSESVLSETEKELGVVLIDFGGGKTDICMFVENAVVYSASLPIGAKNITNDLAIGLRISLNSAEKLKLYLSEKLKNGYFSKDHRKKREEKIKLSQAGVLESSDEVSLKEIMDDIILPRYEEIFNLIGEEISKSGYGNAVPSGIVLTGGGSLSPGLVEIGKKILGLPAKIGYPQKITGLIDEVYSPEFAALVGLAMYIRNTEEKEVVEFKNFDRILNSLSFSGYLRKFKDLLKQFIPGS